MANVEKKIETLLFYVDDSEGADLWVQSPLMVSEQTLIKNANILSKIFTTMKDQNINDIVCASFSFEGWIYSLLEESGCDDVLIDKRMKNFKSFIDSVYLNSKVFTNFQESLLQEYLNDNPDYLLENKIKLYLSFFLGFALRFSTKSDSMQIQEGLVMISSLFFKTYLTFGELSGCLDNLKSKMSMESDSLDQS